MRLRIATAAALLLCALVQSNAGAQDAARVVAIADIHGDVAAFERILKATGLASDTGEWTGGTSTLVQTGDYLDRGAAARAVMDRLRGLESSASRAGGTVHVLLGNHEVMNLIGEYRDVNPAVYRAFADAGSEKRRERAFADYRTLVERRATELRTEPADAEPDRGEWMAAHPPGFIEHAQALSPGGEYGRWLRDRAVAVEVAGTIFMHAGLHPDAAPASVKALNNLVHDEIAKVDAARRHMADRGLILPFFTLKETLAAAQAEAQAIKAGRRGADARHVEMLNVVLGIGGSPLIAPNGPLWFRGFATWTAEEGAAHLPGLLERYGVERFVTGHSVQKSGRITSRFDHRIFLIDTGMSALYNGRASALEIAAEKISAVYPDEREVLTGLTDQRAGAAVR